MESGALSDVGRLELGAGEVLVLGIGLLLSGGMQATLEPPSAGVKARDRERLANAPYNTNYMIPQDYQRHIVEYHRKEAPGTIVIDTDARFLYLVQAGGKAVRYGVTVGEEAQAWSGV